MNRLTKRGKHGTVFAIINGNTVQRVVFQRREYPDKVIWDKYDIGAVYDRLAEYEELGYEPKEIKEIIAQRDRLKRTFEGDGSV